MHCVVTVLNMVSEIRTSDGFVNATKYWQLCWQLCGLYAPLRTNFHNELAKQFVHVKTIPVSFLPCLQKYSRKFEFGDWVCTWSRSSDKWCGSSPGSWIHPNAALFLAPVVQHQIQPGNHQFLYRYVTGQITTDESQTVAAAVAHDMIPTTRSIASHPIMENIQRPDQMPCPLAYQPSLFHRMRRTWVAS
jgi:hypothetical protein